MEPPKNTEANVVLRKAGESDAMFYFNLRNEPSVRESSFNTEEIDLKTHRQWFERKLKVPNAFLFVIEAEGRPVGQVRIDVEKDAGESNISLAPDFRGRGYAPLALKEACRRVFENAPQVKKIFAHIKKGNIASQKSFAKAGFSQEKMVNYKGFACAEMAADRNMFARIKASIIIRAYNAEKTLARALKSALTQDFPRDDFEIVALDDGSTDGTPAILEKYAGERNLKIIKRQNSGAIRAANEGFKAARGEFVALLDADDEFEPNYLKELVPVLEQNVSLQFAYPDYFEEFDGKRKTVAPQNLMQTVAIGTLFRKKDLLEAGGYREGVFFAEYDLLLRTADKWKGRYYAAPLFTYHRERVSLTGNRTRVRQGIEQLKKLHPDKLREIRKIRSYSVL